MKYIRRYVNQTMQNAYMNACDCLYYGYGIAYWIACGIPKEKRQEVWNQAIQDMEWR